jgi:hypothetical protein
MTPEEQKQMVQSIIRFSQTLRNDMEKVVSAPPNGKADHLDLNKLTPEEGSDFVAALLALLSAYSCESDFVGELKVSSVQAARLVLMSCQASAMDAGEIITFILAHPLIEVEKEDRPKETLH